MTTAIIVKYVAWALVNGLGLAGAWFVNFTESDESQRKKLTRAGKLALPLALVSLALALGLTVHDDLTNKRKSRERSLLEADWDFKMSEIIMLLRQKQDKQFQVTNQFLMTMNLSPEVLAEVNALNERRTVLQYQWDELQRQHAELNRSGNSDALERQQMGIRMSEITQEIESVLNRLVGHEVGTPPESNMPIPEHKNGLPPNETPGPPNDNRLPARGNQAPSAPTGLRVIPE